MNLLARQRPVVDGAEVNRRRVSRYSVQAPVTFTWQEGGEKRTGDGWTRDLNGKGAYVYSTDLPPLGTRAKVQVILPPLGESGRILNIFFDAAVLRVDRADASIETSGFALQSQQVVVRPRKEGDSEEIPDLD
jgi:hypothetical protein